MGESLLRHEPELFHEIAEGAGTPVYVYEAQEIRRRYSELVSAFRRIPHRICYSLKANSSLAVLALLRQLGAGADIVCGGEPAPLQTPSSRSLRPRDSRYSSSRGDSSSGPRECFSPAVSTPNARVAGSFAWSMPE